MSRLSEKILIGVTLLILAVVLPVGLISFAKTNAINASVLNSQFTLLVIVTILIFALGLILISRYFMIRKKQKTEAEYLAKLISNVQDAILSTDDQFMIKSWNKGAEIMYGWTAEEAIGTKIDQLLPTEYEEFPLEKLRADFTKEGYFNQELVRRTKAGELIHVLVSSSALYDENGKFNGLVAVNKNITGRKKLEEQLKLANQALEEKIIVKASELNNVFERITDAFLALDKDWRFIYLNKKAGEIISKDPGSMIGKSIWDSFETDGEIADHHFYKSVHKAMDEQMVVHTEVYYAPYGRWFENHIYPSPDGISIFFRDITDKKMTEKNIQDSEEKIRLIMNAALDAIICIDSDDKIIFWNPMAEKIFGWNENEVQGRSLSEIIIPEPFRKMHDHGMAVYKKTGKGPVLNVLSELSAINREGKEFPVELTVLPIKQGNEEFFCAFIRDISTRKRSEVELIEKNTELQKLSAYLQHVREEERKYIAREVHDEIGQLVSALKIDIDWMSIKMPAMDEPAQKRIDHATKTVGILIASIRKIASSLRPSILDHFGLNAAVEWQCKEIQNINSIRCIFNSDFDDRELSIEAKTVLFRITQESLTNTMRHSRAQNVTVEITADIERIYLKITDDGTGFDTAVTKNTLGLIGLRER
ncbi:MAG: PAS domain S-box protein, partial [Sediminibacterium sp.]